MSQSSGVDTSRLDKVRAQSAMRRMPAPGQNARGVDSEVFAQRQLQENANPKTTQPHTTAGPGSHPWIALGPGRTSTTASTRKKIVIPPPHAY